MLPGQSKSRSRFSRTTFTRGIFFYVLFCCVTYYMTLDNEPKRRQQSTTSVISTPAALVTSSQPRDTFIPHVFNETCPIDYLGLPPSIADYCPNDDVSFCRQLTCRNILLGNIGNITSVKMLLQSQPRKRKILGPTFVNMTKDCPEFRRSRGFERKSAAMRDEDIDFPLAFNLLVHRNIEQVG